MYAARMNALRLSIIVPAYNEERTIGQIMDRLHAACPFAELIFVDDGSNDRTLEILKQKAGPNDLVLTKPNGGKGSAVRMGYAHAHGNYTIVQDANGRVTVAAPGAEQSASISVTR